MVAPRALISTTQWMLLITQLCAGWHCTDLEMPDSPIRNLMLDQWKMELNWMSSMNFTEDWCSVTAGDFSMTVMAEDMKCTFGNTAPPLHNGASFSVTAVNMNGTYSTVCRYIPQGINGSAIENFSCVIYNVSLMNCTWQAGRDAPEDTQYFLYWQNSRYDDAMECELYITDENGRNTGCRFQNVRIDVNKAYFLVNGSSKDSLIQFYDEYIQLYKIENLMPPSNITVNCDEIKNDCIIQWQRPQINHSNQDKCFKYEINIKYKDNPEGKPIYASIQEGGSSHTLHRSNARKKHHLKMRAAGSTCLVSPTWGEWSVPVEFGNEEIISSSVWILLVVAAVTLLMAIITILFCKRTSCWEAAFPQIPGPKNAFNGLPDTNPELMESKIQTITSENEEIILVSDVVK
ncbi:granulocyte-macrophage colony-stimulating factor receptor subunit alpha-like isoform X1 [Falco naumanni]|uniref:granulocyte-macrophage colony-stimulating factor receptor subunit alpha-like isoform X1 n=1 Tax=Falco naumanni TaxID=148594 RepID=UPI001ADE6445|nr:granulocyte-macrophage colony-stimulating factor receptor subunit alpha-like isoform X1 [Falco naumanni]